ncbi:MAG: permease, glycerol uptake facilitator [Chthoniobacteraceae bacterium]|nr:permease, glycerol uptake facilitator [Chthoniobacteraceae bacterium]
MNKYICEFIGTFFFVLTVGNTVIGSTSPVIPPLAIGATLMVMIFATGHISGGHLNPAVTLAVWMRGKLPTSDLAGYWGGQLLGAFCAALTVLFLKGHPEVTPMAFPNGLVVPLVAEFLGTFALAFTVLNVATAKANSNNSFYGLAIGFAVVTAAYSLGGYSGGAFNPAIATGIATLGLISWPDIWIHLVADFAGGAVAALAFRTLSRDDIERAAVAPESLPIKG